jgi:hypothetical protein
MINTAIAQFYMDKRGNVCAHILYPDKNAIKLLHPDDNSFLDKKIYYNEVDIDNFEAYFKSAGFREASLLVEGTLEKYCEGLLLSCKAQLHALKTSDFVAEFILDTDSKELTIELWERDKINSLKECVAKFKDDKEIYVATSDVQCSTGIRVAKVESVVLRFRE